MGFLDSKLFNVKLALPDQFGQLMSSAFRTRQPKGALPPFLGCLRWIFSSNDLHRCIGQLHHLMGLIHKKLWREMKRKRNV
jgi:hypothetical protein